MKIAIMILAAGASTRMGSPKQLLPFEGTTLLGHAVDVALGELCGPVFVVLGANETVVRETIAGRAVEIVVNSKWELGLGASISCGVLAVIERARDATGILILLGDQPRIGREIIRDFVESANVHPEGIIAAAYDGTIGVPAYFPAAYYENLLQLDPQHGAKQLLAGLSGVVKPLTVKSNPDIDTMEDYLRAVSEWVSR